MPLHCLRCEVFRARLYVVAMGSVGKTSVEIASFLSSKYGVRYFVKADKVWRDANPSPICVNPL